MLALPLVPLPLVPVRVPILVLGLVCVLALVPVELLLAGEAPALLLLAREAPALLLLAGMPLPGLV